MYHYLWNKCIDLRLLSKSLKGPFLRPLRSKDVQGWILRLRPWIFLDSSEDLATNLKKVKQTSESNGKWLQSSDLFDIDIFLFALLTWVSLWGTIKKTKKIKTLEPFVVQRSALLFWSWQRNFLSYLKKFKVAALKFKPWTSFDLNGLKKGPSKHFEISLKSRSTQINAYGLKIDGRYES